MSHTCVVCCRKFATISQLRFHYRHGSNPCKTSIQPNEKINRNMPNQTTQGVDTQHHQQNSNTGEDDHMALPNDDTNSIDSHDSTVNTNRGGNSTSETLTSNISHQHLNNSPTNIDNIQRFKVDTSLLKRCMDFTSGNSHQMHDGSSTFHSDIKLLDILQRADAPLCLYNQIQEWARKAYTVDPSVFTKNHLPPEKLIKYAGSKMDIMDNQPHTESIYLPGAKEYVEVETFDFIKSVYSLLNDPVLMSEEFLDILHHNDACNPVSPFPIPKQFKDREMHYPMKEVSDGELYSIAYNQHCTNEIVCNHFKQVPLIIIAQLDKTFIDSKGKLTLEPFKFSLHIIKEKIRRLEFSWRPLGYISNQANITSYSSPTEKAADYHVILAAILKSLKEYQEQYDFFLWDMQINSQVHHIAFKPVLGYIIGDNEGHDKLCGKFLNRMHVNRLCRHCDTPIELSDNPFHKKWKHTLGPTISRLVENGDADTLREMSYHCIPNGMKGVIFADQHRGINGATPAERLHLFNHGLFNLILEYNFGIKRSKRTRKKNTATDAVVANMAMIPKKRSHDQTHTSCQSPEYNSGSSSKSCKSESQNSSSESSDSGSTNSIQDSQTNDDDSDSTNSQTNNDDSDSTISIYESDTNDGNEDINKTTDDQELSRVCLFTPSVCKEFDKDAKTYGRILQKQSCRYWNRSYFYQGITSNSKKVGHEERNCLMLCLIIYVSSRYDKYSNMLRVLPGVRTSHQSNDNRDVGDRFDRLIELISETLLIENFMLEPVMTKRQILLFSRYIPRYLDFLKRTIDRTVGMGLKLTKFHIPLHLSNEIIRLSVPINFDSNTVESMHKLEKKCGRRTQLRSSNFEHQTAQRKTEYSIIQRSVNSMKMPVVLSDDASCLDSHSDHENNILPFKGHKMTYHHVGGIYLHRKKPTNVLVEQLPEHPYLLKHINNYLDMIFIQNGTPDSGIPLYTLASILIESTSGRARHTMFRADPLWTDKKKRRRHRTNHPVSDHGWQDFAQVRWITQNSRGKAEFTTIPARLILFLTIPDGYDAHDNSENIIYPPGNYALINSCLECLEAQPPTSITAKHYYKENYGDDSTFTNYLAHASSSILYWSMLEQTNIADDPYIPGQKFPKLYLVRTDDIIDTCIAVPFNLNQNPVLVWLFIKNRDEWMEMFVDDMNVRLEDGQNE